MPLLPKLDGPTLRDLVRAADIGGLCQDISTLLYTAVGATEQRLATDAILASIILVKQLGLDVEGDPRGVLDLGARAGIFAFICRRLGHPTTAVHISSPSLEVIARRLGVHRTIMRIEPQWPLPNFDRKFDFIIASDLACHWSENSTGISLQRWSREDWAFLLHDLINRQLTFPGRICLDLAGGDEAEVAAALALFASHGATITGTVVDWRLEEPLSLSLFCLPDTQRVGVLVPDRPAPDAPESTFRPRPEASIADRLHDLDNCYKGIGPELSTIKDIIASVDPAAFPRLHEKYHDRSVSLGRGHSLNMSISCISYARSTCWQN